MTYIDRIKTRNRKWLCRERVLNFAERLSKKPEVVGVVFHGGMANTPSRDFLDEYSDIDMGIILDLPSGSRYSRLPSWIPNFEFHIPLAEEGEVIEVNIHQYILNDVDFAADVVCDELTKEAFVKTTEIVFDRDGRAGEYIRTMCTWDATSKNKRLSIILSQLHWLVRVNPLRAIRRGFLPTAHQLINEGLELMLEALFILNKSFRPHLKWRYETARDLEWVPEGFFEALAEGMKVHAFDEADVKRRLNVLSPQIDNLVAKSRESGLPPDFYAFACSQAYVNRQLATNTFGDTFKAFIKETLGKPEDVAELMKGLANEYLLGDFRDVLTLSLDGHASKYAALSPIITEAAEYLRKERLA